MAENNEGAQQAPQEPHGSEGGTDYKALYEQTLAESRKWEKRSKANAEKAKAYDELESANKTLEERVGAIEAANKALEGEKARASLVKTVAASTGVSEAIVSTLAGEDEETLTAQAQAIAAAYKTPGGAPNVGEAGKFPHDGEGVDERRQFVRDLLGN